MHTHLRRASLLTVLPFFVSLSLGIAACSSDENPNPNATRTDAGSSQASGLSVAYSSNCARCHGDKGQGQTLNGVVYPAIPGNKDENAFISTVRAGRGSDMPPFDEAAISDADLKADYAWMTTQRK